MLKTQQMSYVGKRPYLNDYQPLISCIYPKKIGLQVGKAVVLTLSTSLLKYNQYLDRAMKAEEEHEEIEPFDTDQLYESSMIQFYEASKRFLSTSFLIKLMEHFTLEYIGNVRLVDRFSKDVQKSLLRKMNKYNAMEACKRIFKTSCWSNSLIVISNYAFDVVSDVINYLRTVTNSNTAMVQANTNIRTFKELIIKISKRLVVAGVGLPATAAGFAIGSYVNTKYGGSLVSLLTEGVVVTVASVALGI